MNAKIERICKDIEKTKGKINEFQARLKELERQRTELENAEIIAAVRGIDIPPAELEAFIQTYMGRKDQLAPETPVHDGVSDNTKHEQEDSGIEE